MSPAILITGCSTGIGNALVRPLLERGFRVYATYRNSANRPEVLAQERADFPALLSCHSLDVSRADEIEAIKSLIENENPEQGLFCLINNAGFGVFGAFEDSSEENIRQQFEVNVIGLLKLTKALLPAIRRGRGMVINLSSILGLLGVPLTSLYCATKHAIEGWSEALACELSPFGVDVCLVEPGGHRTQFSNNISWAAEAFSQASEYRLYNERYKARLHQLLEAEGTPVQGLVKRIIRLVERKQAKSRCLPLRTLSGFDARLFYSLKRLFPAFIFHPLLRWGSSILYYRK